MVHYAGEHQALEPLLGLVADELNVKRIEFAETAHEFGRWRAKPNYKVLGPKLGRGVDDVAAALEGDDGSLASALARGEVAEAAGVRLSPDDVDLIQEVREGWGVASEGGLTVALDLAITKELKREGLARELVRLVQDARKAAGFNVSDRIALGVEASGEMAEAFATHRGEVMGETLATEAHEGVLVGFRQEAEIDGSPVTVTVRKL